MEQIQNLDLVLSVVVKVIFLLLFILIVVIVYRLNKAIDYIKLKADQISTNFQDVSEHVQDELSVDNFFNKLRVVVKDSVQIYLLDNVRKQAFSFIKKFL